MSNATPNYTSIYKNRVGENPFPGLRPFHASEAHLFFGREGQLDEVLEKLEKHKFIAILGTSGSGKSSFMYCGLLPSLSAGFMNNASSNWRMVIARPGIAPLQNLAEALIKSDNQPLTEEDFFVKREYYTAVLKASSLGLLELCKQKRKNQNEQILLLVDQFEELFRFINAEENFLHRSDDSLAYVRLITRALQQSEIPIYVVMTMRSDYIGDCARFPDLTAYINKSHYLIPQMTREQKRMAILGPIAVSGAKITHRLLQQLLNDLGDNQDQLPIMQHALMRTWNYWIEHSVNGEPLDIQHYEGIGTMSAALSIHAKEAFDDLTEHQKFICEKIFKSITEKGTDGRGIRRPTKLKYIAEIIGATVQEVIEVIEVFRKPGRTLLMPMPPAELFPETVVDISHESLMRIWETLREWVEEEADSVKMYLRLSEAAHAYQLGKARLWRPPDLLVAMNWREKNKPNIAWAQRHEPAFERAMVFLDISQNDYEEEQRVKDHIQKERLKRRAHSFAIFMTICVLLAICMLTYSYIQKVQAERSKEEAVLQRHEAEKQSIEANRQRKVALNKQREAQEQKIIAENQRQYAEAKAIEVLNQKQLAEKALQEVRKQEELARFNEQKAVQQSKIAEQQTLIAEQNARKTEIEGKRAMQEEAKANPLRFLSLSQSMAVKSLQFKDPETKSVLAQQAYNFNDEYNGNPYNPDIFAGLYYAEKALEGPDFNSMKEHTDAVRALTFDNNGKRLFTAGSDNKIFVWNAPFGGQSKPQQINDGIGTHIFRNIQISPNGKFLAVGTDESDLQLYNATTLAFIDEVKIHRQGVISLIFSPDGRGIITAGGDNTIKYTDIQTLQSYVVCQEKEKIKSLTALNGTSKIVYLLKNTVVKTSDIAPDATPVELFRESTKDEGSALAVSDDGKWLAAGFQSGKLQIWNLRENKPEVELLGHDTWISDIKFSRPKAKDGVAFLASASFDGTAKVWITEKWDDAPIVLNDHLSWVWSVAFTPDASYIVTGCVDDVIRVYPTDMEAMSKRVCEKLPRNMTEKEWKRFVGEDIRYQPTCKNHL